MLSNKYKILIIAFLLAVLLLGYAYRSFLWEVLISLYTLLWDREQIKAFISSFGMAAPFIFILVQVLQVLIAPVPGEASGFIGGYLFGTLEGFLYSSIGLAVGSWLNFAIGRFLGKRFIRKLIPAAQFKRFDTLVKHQGVILLFILFVLPGFPKDFLCLFLGISTLSPQVFIILAAFGRMPGTFMLSYQGATLYQQMYGTFAIICGVCLVLGLIGIRYRTSLYQWLDKFEKNGI